MSDTTQQASATATYIRFVLRMLEPGAVTVPRPARPGEVDAVPDTDCRGRLHLPGTSLAGALRDWTRRAYDETVADTWFGQLLDPARESVGQAAPDTVDAVASAVWVLGSELVDEHGNPRTDETGLRLDRWSTAIDRDRGAARAYSLHGVTLLAPDTRFEVFLRWDDVTPNDLDRLLRLLAAWQPVLGRGTSRGLGRCVVENLRHGTIDLTEPVGLATWLRLSGPDLVRTVAVHKPEGPHDQTVLPDPTGLADPTDRVVDIPVELAGPLRIGGAPPLLDAQGRQVQAVLRERDRLIAPGAGLKGVIRSRVEFILRSVGLDTHACTGSADDGAPCGRCWVCGIFGHGGTTTTNTASVGARARIRFGDAVITDTATRRRNHVAIDRFTGGAADELLYTDEVVETGRFTLHVEMPDNLADDPLFTAVLRLALADLHDGLLGIGHAVTRGYGSIQLDLTGAEANGTLPTLDRARRELATARHAHATAGGPALEASA